MKLSNIKLKEIKGTWYEINRTTIYGKEVILLESEQYGEDVPSIAVDTNLKVLFTDIWNGLEEVEERLQDKIR